LRIGLFGGRFDPIHNAHLIIADYIREEIHLDRVLFIPAAQPPHKGTLTSGELRLQMVTASIEDDPFFSASDIENQRSGPSYSIDTIRILKEKYRLNRSDLFWIMGADNFLEFHNWREPEGILQLCQIVVFPRAESGLPGPEAIAQDVIYLKDAPLLDISSTLIRQLIKGRRSIRYLVPPKVLQIINKFELYSVND
jgi:nicotinate-nucleotide adenylyltransferase